MFLRRVAIQNFRAIKSMSIDLDPESTVLIGENGSGKTSFFAVLAACLGLRNDGQELVFERRDFRAPADDPDGDATEPIRVLFEFAEQEPGEWESIRGFFGAAVFTGEHNLAVLKWKINAQWNADTEAAEITSSFLDAEDQPLTAVPVPQLVTELRRLNPFLVFRGRQESLPGDSAGVIQSADEFLTAESRSGSEIEKFTREIYGKLSEGWENLTQKDMRKARAAAKRVWKQLVNPRRTQSSNARKYRLPSGGAQSLGPLLVFGALLSARGARPLGPDVDPIFGAERIGAHLHPATLGSVRYVLDSLPVQKILSSYSRETVAALPLRSLRRMVRRRSGIEVYQFHEDRLKKDDLRRIGYHVRSRRGGALFDRCWLLVEGETEFWLMPEMGRLCGYEFDAEGVGVVEFAQCGLAPILELARQLGISWHVLVDGDDAGDHYVQAALPFLNGAKREDHITQLPFGDIEHYLWRSGYANVYTQAARLGKKGGGKKSANSVINRAISARSKPFLAISVIEAIRTEKAAEVPDVLRDTINTVVRLARAN
jgi:putative ATP-dependent endonuclease of OLD family